MGADGKEVLAPLRLNSEESSQRRHFMNATKEMVAKVEEDSKKLANDYNDFVASKRSEYEAANPVAEEATEEEKSAAKKAADEALNKSEELKAALTKANDEIKEMFSKKQDVHITDKTLGFVKKYFVKFGNTTGFALGDDEVVEGIDSALASVEAAK